MVHIFSFTISTNEKKKEKEKKIYQPIQVHLSPSKKKKKKIQNIYLYIYIIFYYVYLFFFFLANLRFSIQIKSSYEQEYRLFKETFPSPDWLLVSLSGITQNASCCRKTLARHARSHVQVCVTPKQILSIYVVQWFI